MQNNKKKRRNIYEKKREFVNPANYLLLAIISG